MRMQAKICLFFAIAAAAAVPAGAAELLVNGGFETGDFSGWTKSVQSGSSGNAFVVPNVSGVSPLSGFSLPQLNTGGQYYAVTDQTGPGSYALTQSFTTDGTSPLSVSFDLLVQNSTGNTSVTSPARDFNTFPNQNLVVDILRAGADPFTSDPADVVANLFGPSGISNPWTSYNFNLGTLAAGTYQFRFSETDNQGFFQGGLDNVEVRDASVNVPEPASLGLIGAGVASMLRARRRRTKATNAA